MPERVNLTPAEEQLIRREVAEIRSILQNNGIVNPRLRSLVETSLDVMETANGRDDVEVERVAGQLTGVTQTIDAFALNNNSNGNGAGGTGFVDCLNDCHSEWERCRRSNAQFLCSLQSMKCIMKCGTSGSNSIGGLGFATRL